MVIYTAEESEDLDLKQTINFEPEPKELSLSVISTIPIPPPLPSLPIISIKKQKKQKKQKQQKQQNIKYKKNIFNDFVIV